MLRFFWRGGLSKVFSQSEKATASTGRLYPVRTRIPTLEQLESRTVPALIGSEFHVNTVTSGDQFDSANASSSNGTSVVVWTHRFSGGNSDIRAQMFNANGSRLGFEIIVASTPANETAPAVAMDDLGAWKVVWTEGSTTNSNIMAARFSSSGTRLGTNFRVASTTQREYEPSVAVSGGGDFVVSYTLATAGNHNVLAKTFTSSGTLLNTITVASSSLVERRSAVSRSTSPNGNFAVAYEAGEDIFLKRYSASGTLLGTHTIASGSSRQIRPSIAMDDFGRTVVVWQALVNGQWDMFARKVGSDGILTTTFTVGNGISNETDSAVALRSDGRFVVAFEIGTSVFVREMASNGFPLSNAILVASTGSGSALPAISISGNGTYFVTYTALNRPNEIEDGIFGRFGRLA